MKKILLILIGLTVLYCQNVCAQQTPINIIESSGGKKLNNSEWQDTVDKIKADTKSLLDQNNELQSEYSFLKEKLSDLNENVAKIKKEIDAQKRRMKA